MIFKFEEMLYEMYGEGYEDAIDCFMDYLHMNIKGGNYDKKIKRNETV